MNGDLEVIHRTVNALETPMLSTCLSTAREVLLAVQQPEILMRLSVSSKGEMIHLNLLLGREGPNNEHDRQANHSLAQMVLT